MLRPQQSHDLPRAHAARGLADRPHPSARSGPRRTAALALALGLVGAPWIASCGSTGGGGDVPSSAIGSRLGSYALSTTPEDLERLIAEDLEADRPAAVRDGLEAWVGENDRRGSMARAAIVWASVRPVSMMQYGGGRSHMTAVRQLGEVVRSDGAAQRNAAIEALRSGQLGAVARHTSEPTGLFHPSTVELAAEVDPELSLYAKLADALLSYRSLATSAEPDPAALARTLDALEGAEVAVSSLGDARAAFLANVAAAQSLERSGQLDAAAEFWMRVANSPEYPSQPALLRDLVAARIESYTQRSRERIILEVEGERRAELRTQSERYEQRLAELRLRFDDFGDWAERGLERVERLAVDAADAGAAGDAAVRGELRAELQRAAEISAERARTLEQRLAETRARIEDLRRRVAAGEDAAGAAATELQRLSASVAALERDREARAAAAEAAAAAAAAEADPASAPESAPSAAPARLGLDAFPDVFALLDGARGAAAAAGERVSTLIVPR